MKMLNCWGVALVSDVQMFQYFLVQFLQTCLFFKDLEKIIQRDFFPDLPKLKAQTEYLEALESNNVAKLRQLHARYGQKPGRIPTADICELKYINQYTDRYWHLFLNQHNYSSCSTELKRLVLRVRIKSCYALVLLKFMCMGLFNIMACYIRISTFHHVMYFTIYSAKVNVYLIVSSICKTIKVQLAKRGHVFDFRPHTGNVRNSRTSSTKHN